jgi:lipoate-protein ligase A
VLQHGSLRLRPDPPGAREAAGLAADVATSLAELGHPLDPARVRDACCEAFEAVLGVRLEAGRLDASERSRALALASSRASEDVEAVPSGFSREPFAGR